MKLAGEVAAELFPLENIPKLITPIILDGTFQNLEKPSMSDQITCPRCFGTKGMTCFVDPSMSDDKCWFCLNPECLKHNAKTSLSNHTPTLKKRSMEWSEFCDKSQLGNRCHEICFENLDQSKSKIDFMYSFAKSPNGILVLQGTPGTGKSYSALAICELFTRDNVSCSYLTQSQLMDKWIFSFKDGKSCKDSFQNVDLLVLDEFGGREPSSGFLEFFMEILSYRLQCKNKGTIIVTNLGEKHFAAFCKDALSDRINTGQYLIFEGKSRRKPVIR